jgi:hypothetical protein
MKSLFLSIAAVAAVGALSGCAAYGDPYGYGGYGYGPGYGYAQPSVSIGVGTGYYGNGYYNGYYAGRGYNDRDRDGVPNRVDRDRDGDGIRNGRDVRPNNPWR